MKAKNAIRLGFGCAAIPGPLSPRDALTMLETAYTSGIRHFDTARMYSSGDSEAVLGELVRQRRAELTIVSKAGIAPTSRLERGLNLFASAFNLSQQESKFGLFEPEQIQRSVETSLRKLQTEQIDLLLLHEIRAHEVKDGLKQLLETMRSDGKIGAYGIATSVQESEALIGDHPELCNVVQVPVQWLDRPRALPVKARLVVHSVLGGRLTNFLQRLETDLYLARRFKEEAGLVTIDAGHIGRLMLQAAMLRNPSGVTLFSTARLERLRRNTELLTAKIDTPAVEALERAMQSADPARDHETAL